MSNGFKEANDEYMNLLQGKEEPNEDERFNLVSSLKKVECFYNPHNMSQWRIWESMFDILLKLKECLANNEEVKIPVEAIKLVCTHILALSYPQVRGFISEFNYVLELSLHPYV